MNKYFKVGNFDSAKGARIYTNKYTDAGKFISGNIALEKWDGATLITEEEYNNLDNTYILVDGIYYSNEGKALHDEQVAQEEVRRAEEEQAYQTAVQAALERKVSLAVRVLGTFLEQGLFAKDDLPMILSFFNVPREVITPTMERLNADQP